MVIKLARSPSLHVTKIHRKEKKKKDIMEENARKPGLGFRWNGRRLAIGCIKQFWCNAMSLEQIILAVLRKLPQDEKLGQVPRITGIFISKQEFLRSVRI